MTTATSADPKFALRLAEAALLRAQAAEYELSSKGVDGWDDGQYTRASQNTFAAQAQYALAQADWIEHVAKEEQTTQVILGEIRDAIRENTEAVKNQRFR